MRARRIGAAIGAEREYTSTLLAYLVAKMQDDASADLHNALKGLDAEVKTLRAEIAKLRALFADRTRAVEPAVVPLVQRRQAH